MDNTGETPPPAEAGETDVYVLVPGGFGFFDYMAVRERIRDHARIEGAPITAKNFYLPVVEMEADNAEES